MAQSQRGCPPRLRYFFEPGKNVAKELTESASGVPGLDFHGGIVAWLIVKCGFDPATIAKVYSGNQARFFGLRDRGSISLGKRADLTILDLKSVCRATSRNVFSKCAWTPYELREPKNYLRKHGPAIEATKESGE